ncbi:MAG: UDP-N-acetylmuramoyl-L-alanyl-D-glutamate--2,6-diaminopimelate ligase, partial [Candidatus Levybacteria bacterium]|nr:UDP-N-acetylmuramoyl-L-alanyl-D-glutamate--2,6-diaminopimelate ligase [Candidatus Levybacteria bacterium]
MWQDVKNVYHLIAAFLANLWFGFPSKKLTVIGVTGTDGKTTTVNLIYHILKTSGRKASMISSVGAVINGKVYDTGFHVTTP